MPQPPASSHIYVQSRIAYYTFKRAKLQGFYGILREKLHIELSRTFSVIFVQVADIAKYAPFDYNINEKQELFDCV